LATDLLARIRGELEQRMVELRPLLEEHERLLTAIGTLTAMDGEAAAGGKPAKSTVSKARRSSPGGGRSAVSEAPGSKLGRGRSAVSDAPGSKLGRGRSAVSEAPRSKPGRGRSAVSEAPRSKSGRGRSAASKAPGSRPGRGGTRKRPAPSSPDQQAILAALEHGSHTPSELVMVTGLAAPSVRRALSGLAGGAAITKVKREGKTAYALS
jgi:hypothetical protein